MAQQPPSAASAASDTSEPPTLMHHLDLTLPETSTPQTSATKVCWICAGLPDSQISHMLEKLTQEFMAKLGGVDS